jgi:hypothetical protein
VKDRSFLIYTLLLVKPALQTVQKSIGLPVKRQKNESYCRLIQPGHRRGTDMQILVATDGTQTASAAARKALDLLKGDSNIVLVTGVHGFLDPMEDAGALSNSVKLSQIHGIMLTLTI